MSRKILEKSRSGPKAGTSSSSVTEALSSSVFNSLALDVSLAGLSVTDVPVTSPENEVYKSSSFWRLPDSETDSQLWEDIGVVEYLETKHVAPDQSTEEERVEILKEVLRDTDIHEGDGSLSDFLFHVARTKNGKIYIRVIRTLLLNRGT